MPLGYGGCFAKPITPECLQRYKLVAATASPPIVKEWLEKLIVMYEVFQETPESANPGVPHQSGTGTIVPLEEAEIQRIWDHVPYKEELDMIQALFDKLPSGRNEHGAVIDKRAEELREVAFHLLWYAVELCLDRQPCTTDRL